MVQLAQSQISSKEESNHESFIPNRPNHRRDRLHPWPRICQQAKPPQPTDKPLQQVSQMTADILHQQLAQLADIQASLDALRLDIQDNVRQLQAQGQTLALITTSQD